MDTNTVGLEVDMAPLLLPTRMVCETERSTG